MPTYLCHGFRWHRDAIRFFVIVQDIDDAAPGWVVAPRSSDAILAQFYDLFDFLPYRDRRQHGSDDLAPQGSSGVLGQQGDPATSGGERTHTQETSTKRGKSPSRRPRAEQRGNDDEPSTLPAPQLPDPPGGEEEPPPPSEGSAVTLLEEFDPSNLSIVSGPWAYVADHVVRVDTSAPIVDEMLRYNALEQSRDYKAMSGGGSGDETGRNVVSTVDREDAGWLEKLRDKLQSSELIRWYVVVCGDEERDAYDQDEQEEEEDDEYSPKQEEDEDKTIGATSEGHHEQQQSPPKEAAAVGERGDNTEGAGGGGGVDYKFRLPELLDSKGKARPRDPKADWNAVLEKPPPFFKKEPPPAGIPLPLPLPLPAGAAVHHKTATSADASSVRQGTSRTKGFRNFFARRLRAGRKVNNT